MSENLLKPIDVMNNDELISVLTVHKKKILMKNIKKGCWWISEERVNLEEKFKVLNIN